MQEAIQSPAAPKRGRPSKPAAFSLPADDRLTDSHTLIDVGYEGKLFFIFGRDGTEDEISVSYTPSKTDFSALMDAVKQGRLTVGTHAVSFRGAVREAMHAAVITAHFRSL